MYCGCTEGTFHRSLVMVQQVFALSGTAPTSLFMSTIVLDNNQWCRRIAPDDSRASNSSSLGLCHFVKKGFLYPSVELFVRQWKD